MAQPVKLETLRFLTPELVAEVRARFGTPAYVYDQATLLRNADAALAFPNAYGLAVAFAMKACPSRAVLRIFAGRGLHFDASSAWEVERALRAGVAPEKICLSTQEMPPNFSELNKWGIRFNASSLRQLELFGRQFPGETVGVRLNPGLGSGHSGKTNVGGPDSSFGIWHESLEEIHDIVANHRLRIARVHSHIGSGADPAVWQKTAKMTLRLVREFPTADTVNLGGGFKVARVAGEKATDLPKVGKVVQALIEKHARETGQRLKLEIEPGTFLTANAGALVCTVQDKVSTGQSGREFLKLDAGMTEILRPSLYGSQHGIVIVPAPGRARQNRPAQKYVVVGHCCESGDLLTPVPGESDQLGPRLLNPAEIGDLCVIEGAGAYCAAMSAKNYNSFPEAPEILLETSGKLRLVRKRQTLEQIVQNEIE